MNIIAKTIVLPHYEYLVPLPQEMDCTVAFVDKATPPPSAPMVVAVYKGYKQIAPDAFLHTFRGVRTI